jgi:MoaA/NifB/PqqE/SkfB family radical SAM enzyme
MKSEFPYLVDIGLGNLCHLAGSKCHIPCYASATKKGKMARYDFIIHSLDVLFNSNVFEVNFGGLEPTLYNEDGGILGILRRSKTLHFRTAITTRNYEWYKLREFKEHVENIDSVAISCNTQEDIDAAAILRDELLLANLRYDGVYIQNILGLHPYEQLADFLEYAKIKNFRHITLLGYKEFGFGVQQQPYEIPDFWIDLVKEIRLNVGVDSVVVSKWRDKLIEAGIWKNTMVGEEGKQTCYLDGLTQSLAASSFTDKHIKLSPNFNKKEFLEVYEKL